MTERPAVSGSRWVALRPGWPLVAFYSLFPVWWLLGLGALGGLLVGVVLAGWLVRQHRVALPPGAWVWGLFLAWALAGAFVLWVQVPGTMPSVGLDRLIPWAFRVSWYLAATLVFVYVANHDRTRLPDVRLHRALACLFLFTVAGGYIGFLFPRLEIRSALEVVLPGPLRGIDFLMTLVHPTIAQAQDIGVEVFRPAAPYLYANDWGAHFGLLVPFFVLAWAGKEAGWRRRWFPLLALVSVPPAIFTLNRGLWLGLGVVAVFIAVRLALRGRLAALALLSGVLLLGGAVVVATPLGTMVQSRMDNQHSNEGRGELASRSVEAVLEHSPLVGFGATRAVSGNFYSIAGGRTAECPTCAPPNLGTQGLFWTLVFSHGLAGAALFLTAAGRRCVDVLRDGTDEGIALGAVAVYYAAVMFVYDLGNGPTMILAITLALAWRTARERGSAQRGRHSTRVRGRAELAGAG